MKTRLAISMAALLIAAAGIGTAHPASYIGANPCPGGLFTSGLPVLGLQGCFSSTNCENNVLGTGASIGAVEFCPGHLAPDADGKVTLTIIDDFFNPTGGAYCQDLNNNSVCGEKDPLAPAGVFIEPRVFVCAVVTLDSPFVAGSKTPAQWAAGENWDTTKSVLIFIDGAGNGNAFRGSLPSDPVNNPGPIPPVPQGHACNDASPYHGGTHGIVMHS